MCLGFFYRNSSIKQFVGIIEQAAQLKRLINRSLRIVVMKIISALIIFLSAITASMARDTLRLTIEDCRRMGLENNSQLKIREYKQDAASAVLKSSQVSRYPSVSLSGQYARLSEVPPFSIATGAPPPFPDEIVISDAILDYYSLKTSVVQPLFTGFRISRKISLDESILNISRNEKDSAVNALLAEIEYTFWNICKLIENRQLLIENDKILREHKDVAEAFYAEGLITKDEIYLTDAKIAVIRQLSIENDDAIETGKFALKNLIGLSYSEKIELQYELPEVQTCSMTLEESISAAIEARPEIRMLAERIKAAESAVAIANSSYYPQLYLVGNYHYDRPNERYMPARKSFEDSWDISLSMSMELWNWGKTNSRRQEAIANLRITQEELEEVRGMIELETAGSYYLLNRMDKKLETVSSALKYAGESYRMAKERFKNGAISNSELLEIEGILLERQVEVVHTRVDYRLAKTDFNRTIGIISAE